MTIYVSLSEISSFLECRTRWDYSSINRQGLRHKTSPRPYLTLGSAVHRGIEAQIEGLDPVTATQEYLDEEKAKQTAAYEEATGTKLWDVELEAFQENADLALGMVKQYFKHYGTENPLADVGLKYIGTEITFKIPLDFLDFDDVVLVGTFDGLAQDEYGNVWLVENKTYTSPPDIAELQFHFQITGYAVAFEWLTGLPIKGVLYNGLSKRLIKLPTVLQSGAISTDKRQAVTMESYLFGLQQAGEDVFDKKYTGMLTHLKQLQNKGDTRFFFRDRFYFPAEQLQSWKEDFNNVVSEMYGYRDDSYYPVIYRTVPHNGCGKSGSDCWFKDLCQADHSGGDSAFVRESRYKKGTYGTLETIQAVTPQVISSVSDLIHTLQQVDKPSGA